MTHAGTIGPIIPLDEIAPLIEQACLLARQYMELTGKPLGITGEVAEFEASRLLNLQLVDARQPGYDALRGEERIQIKGRAVPNPKKCASQRVGSINLKKEWNSVVLVLMDQTFKTFEIWEASRANIEKALTKPGSKARNERGSLSVSQFRAKATRVWERQC